MGTSTRSVLPVRLWRILIGLGHNPRGGALWIVFRTVKSLIGLTKVGHVTFYPKEQLPWVAELEANWMFIRKELDEVLAHPEAVVNVQDAYEGQSELTQDDKWKAFTLIREGKREEANTARCPETMRLLDRIPGLGNAFFSILDGKKHLEAHRGRTGGLLNCHLALLVPPNPSECRIRVGDATRSWEEGKLIVFDESNEHEVWNDSDATRVVLLMYVFRPFPFPLSVLNRLLLGMATLLHRASPSKA